MKKCSSGSTYVERMLWDHEVVGSIPARCKKFLSPTFKKYRKEIHKNDKKTDPSLAK